MKLHAYQAVARDFLLDNPRAALYLAPGSSLTATTGTDYPGRRLDTHPTGPEDVLTTSVRRRWGRPVTVPPAEPRACSECREVFTPVKYRPQAKYCSRTCSIAPHLRNTELQRRKGRLGGAVRGQQKVDAATANGYRQYVKARGENRHAHRIIAEVLLGRGLLPGELVHHEDLDKTNNDPRNLVVFVNQSVHARHHKLDHCGLVDVCGCEGIRLWEVTPT